LLSRFSSILVDILKSVFRTLDFPIACQCTSVHLSCSLSAFPASVIQHSYSFIPSHSFQIGGLFCISVWLTDHSHFLQVFFAADMVKNDPDVLKRWAFNAKKWAFNAKKSHHRLLDELSGGN
jgi:hypothetical protein